jgi:hypothetical protein
MKPRSIPILLALCVSLAAPPLVSTSYAQAIAKSHQERLIAIGKQLRLTPHTEASEAAAADCESRGAAAPSDHEQYIAL